MPASAAAALRPITRPFRVGALVARCRCVRPLRPARPASPAPVPPLPGHIQPQPALLAARRLPHVRRSTPACAGSVPRTPVHRRASRCSGVCELVGRSWPIALGAAGKTAQPAPIGTNTADDADRARRAWIQPLCRAFSAEARSFGQRHGQRSRRTPRSRCPGRLQRRMGAGNRARNRLLHRLTAQQERHHQRHQHVTGTGHVHRQQR